MIITLDGRRLDDACDPQCSLQDCVDRVRDDHLGERLVVAVSIDGCQLVGDSLNERLTQPMGSTEQIDLESSTPEELVANALHGLAQQFKDTAEHCDEIADRLAGGEVADAMHDVSEFVGLWQTSYRVVTECGSLLEDDLTAHESEGRTIKNCLDELVDKLNEFKDALESKDLVLMADLVRYELPPLCETWDATLAGIANQICPVGTST